MSQGRHGLLSKEDPGCTVLGDMASAWELLPGRVRMICRHSIGSLWARTPLNTDFPLREQFLYPVPGLVLLSLATEPPKVMTPPWQSSLPALVTFTLSPGEGSLPPPHSLLSSLYYNINLYLCSLPLRISLLILIWKYNSQNINCFLFCVP